MVRIPIPAHDVWVAIRYVVLKWRGGGSGFEFDYLGTGNNGKRTIYVNTMLGSSEHVTVIDPLTAIGLGLVTPEELGYPEGILAAFNLLKGN